MYRLKIFNCLNIGSVWAVEVLLDIIRTNFFWSRTIRYNTFPERKKEDLIVDYLQSLQNGFFFFPLANLAESEAGNNQNLAGFNTDSLGRMDGSETSNKGFCVHKFIKWYQIYSISLPSRNLSLIITAFAVMILAALFKP